MLKILLTARVGERVGFNFLMLTGRCLSYLVMATHTIKVMARNELDTLPESIAVEGRKLRLTSTCVM